MKDVLFRKGLVFSIIVLFVGVSVIPSITGNDEKKSETNTDIDKFLDEYRTKKPITSYSNNNVDNSTREYTTYRNSQPTALDGGNSRGWSIETVDSDGDVGWYTSLALDDSDHPHISYWDYSNYDLKYAYWTGSSWSIETVDSDGDVGTDSSLALDGSGHPHISYNYYDDGNNLKYAYWTGSSWSIETVDDDVGSDSSLALDGSGHPHISYYKNTRTLKYAYWTGSSWSIETVDIHGNVEKDSSLALDDSDHPHISYYDNSDDLKYAYWTGSSWSIETVDSCATASRGHSSLALDGSDHPHISYTDDWYSGDLKYAYWTGSSWSIETVDSFNIGQCNPSLALDDSDHPHISYTIWSVTDLKYAYWTGSSWSIETVDGDDYVGGISSLALDDSGHPHISYCSWDNSDLKYAKKTNGGNQPPIADAGGPYSGEIGEPILFDASGSYDPDGEIVGYRWDWTNDGSWDTGWLSSPTKTHTYNSEFHGQVKLEVKDDEDATDTDTANVDIGGEPEPYYFIHITDTHVVAGGTDRWDAVRNEILSWSDKPEFVICTGDLVDWGAGVSGHANFWAFVWNLYWTLPENWYLDSEHEIPICFCPGNHDSRYIYQAAPPYSLINYNLIVNVLLYYKTIIGNSAIFSLNSGNDCWPWGGFPWWPYTFDAPGSIWDPEGAGLYSLDVLALIYDLDSLDGSMNGVDTSDYVKIIMLHHPHINPDGEGGDTNDAVFWNLRPEFKQICNQFDVDLVFNGHLHSDGIWDLDGGSWSSGDGTKCISTSAVKDYYSHRLIKVIPIPARDNESEIIVENPTYLKSTINLDIIGRINAYVYNDKGNYTGVNETGDGIDFEIPGSTFSRWIYDNETLGINQTYIEASVDRNYSSDYEYIIEGLANDTMNLTVEVHLKNGQNAEAFYENVTLYTSSVAKIYANDSIVDYTLKIEDPDGTTREVQPTNYTGNLPPEIPDRPAGPNSGKIREEYTFETSTIDSDYGNQQIYYMWDWGDGNYSDWLGPYESGEICEASYTWVKPGSYEIRVKAKDVYNDSSNWSEPLTVNITKMQFTSVFLLGLISDVNESEDFTSFNANLLLWLSFNPFDFKICSSGEEIIISDDYQGLIYEPLIIGSFMAAVI